MTAARSNGRRSFDGIICIGGQDWWYHNRGHFDTQIMRRLARSMPVLFVNSVGVRMPSFKHDRNFAARIGRKLKSFARGLVHVENGFWVFSPVTAPGAAAAALARWALAPQIKLAARRAGIRRPLLWIHCPPGVGLIDEIEHAGVVLQRTDRYEAFPDGDPDVLRRQVDELKRRADLVIYAAPAFEAEERAHVKASALITHGVDLDTFIAAGDGAWPEPADICALPRKRVGFIGGIDAHTFDPPLFLAVASALPDATFAMIGGCSLPEGWCTLPNVHFLGRKPYEEVARYMAACDALIMPWNKSDWIQACNPIKLKEYLAVSRPVVTTDFPALDGWRDLVHVARDAGVFTACLRAALDAPHAPDEARRRLATESWDAKAVETLAAFAKAGITPAAMTGDRLRSAA